MRAGQERPGSPEHSPRLEPKRDDRRHCPFGQKKSPLPGGGGNGLDLKCSAGGGALHSAPASHLGGLDGRQQDNINGRRYCNAQIPYRRCESATWTPVRPRLRSVQRSQHGPPRRHISGPPVGSLRRNVSLDEAKVDAGRTHTRHLASADARSREAMPCRRCIGTT
jgi:hypothetical protein